MKMIQRWRCLRFLFLLYLLTSSCTAARARHVENILELKTESCVQKRWRTPARVPSPLVIAYASWGQCDDKIVSAAQNGANVIIWFSITLEIDPGTFEPIVSGSIPPVDCVAKIANRIRNSESISQDVLHMVSIGGWNAPLPNTSFSAETWLRVISKWNEITYSRPELGWYGFDGFDWDAEGNDDPNEVKNHVLVQHCHLIGKLSSMLKQVGYIVSLAPSQSYLDVDNPIFDFQLTHAPTWKPDFHYHGANWYAFILLSYNNTKVRNDNGKLQSVATFDWVSLQLYEGWSRANDMVANKGVAFETYIEQLVNRMDQGWDIHFGPELGGVNTVSVPREQLVIGLANAWTPPYPPTQKFLFVRPESISRAWKQVTFAGYMFWTISEEGSDVDGKPLYLTREIASTVADK